MVGQGIVSGTFSGNRNFTGNVSFAQGASGAGLSFIKKDTQIWYVDSGKTSPSVSGDGLTWEHAFVTLQEAVTAAGDYDTILIAPNSIQTIAVAGIAITQDGLRIFGANGTEGRQAAALKIAAGTASMFQVEGNRFEIAGLNLSQRTAYPCILIGSGSTGAIYETWVHHCNFDGYGTATHGVKPNGTTDTVSLCVEDCYFQSHATAAIEVNGTRDTYRRNTIKVAADTIGINVIKTGASRTFGVIADNLLFGVTSSSTTAIKLAGNITAGHAIIARNLLSGSWNVTITQSTGLNGVENYEASSTGGSLIDTSS